MGGRAGHCNALALAGPAGAELGRTVFLFFSGLRSFRNLDGRKPRCALNVLDGQRKAAQDPGVQGNETIEGVLGRLEEITDRILLWYRREGELAEADLTLGVIERIENSIAQRGTQFLEPFVKLLPGA